MPNLPVVGGSPNTWGDELNEFLRIGHEEDGRTKSLGPIFNVKDAQFGAIGDGIIDDTVAIQTAIQLASDAGSGRVYLPVGTYKLGIAGTSQGALYIGADNLTIYGDGAASILKSTLTSQGVFHPSGSHKISTTTIEGWYDFRSFWPINPATRNANSITCVTAGDAANFSAGDFIFIRTGECVFNNTFQPDAEVNQVVSVNAGTGVVTLRAPLSKNYVQEYFAVGSSALTTTTASMSAGATSVTVTSTSGFSINDEVTFSGGGGKLHKAQLTGVGGGALTFANNPVSPGATIANGASVTNANGITSTSVTTRVAALGVANVQAITLQNFNVHDLTVDNSSVTNAGPNFAGGQIVGMDVERVNHIGKGAFISQGNVRDSSVRNCTGHMITGCLGTWIGWGPGSGELVVSDNLCYNDDYNQGVVFSEGCYGVVCADNIFKGKATSNAADIPISVQSRSGRVIITGNEVFNGGTDAGIVVASSAGSDGIVADNIIEGGNFTAGINIGVSSWQVHDNHFDPAIAAPGLIQYGGGSGQKMERFSFSQWVRFDRQTAVLGTIGGRFIITQVFIHIQQQFNSSGTDFLTVGHSGDHSAYSGNNDVSTAFGPVTPTAGSLPMGYYEEIGKRTITAYYVAGGGAPTQGRVLVTVDAIQVPFDQ